ncbi:hypothetical protein KRX52_12505 [Pseudomonas sp. MAP12]|uniref:Sulfotransferase n=1 Tax=Geopseudomonas aromaticivorans TaxID=2849492 RepID=A0ABS6MXS7_9GAMM|nr:hypothetical protein [Pseudomonas aromaticivorans]MBV2133614.1 hypothetical protein [Pseudomonas aromaticivorans]
MSGMKGAGGSGLDPIFIHSLFRSGSTYFFNIFRESPEGYWCYQEPLHEWPLLCAGNKEGLLDPHVDVAKELRHPELGRPYFYELYEVADKCLPLLKKEYIYDSYFGGGEEGIGEDYFEALIGEAKGRPVIQECRTSSRIGTIKKKLGGLHLYLWRNPWDQWWSCNVNEYFDAACQLFINSRSFPEAVGRLRQEIKFEGFFSDNLAEQFGWFKSRRLSSEDSYLVFYLLWCIGLLEGMRCADLLINIDSLSDSHEYRRDTLAALKEVGVFGLDFSACSVPQACYGMGDREFFVRIEDKVHGLLLISGLSQRSIDELIALRRAYEPLVWRDEGATASTPQLIRDAERARALARRFNSQGIEQRIKYEEQLAAQHELYTVAEARAVAAEARAQQAEARAVAAEAQAEQAEARAVAAEAQAEQVEARAVAAEAQAEQGEARAVAAEAQAGQANARAVVAEAQARQANARAVAAESQAEQAEARATVAEIKAEQAKIGVSAAKATAQQAEAASTQCLAQVQAVFESTSWKITKPLRMLSETTRRIVRRSARLAKALLRPCLTPVMHLLLSRPAARARVVSLLRSFPLLDQHLRLFARNWLMRNNRHPMPPVAMSEGSGVAVALFGASTELGDTDLSDLTAQAQRNFHKLHAAIQQRALERQ